MVHAYHVIWGTYGFWLPNDPRGSWSDFVYAWELARFGKATKSSNRIDVEPSEYARWRSEACAALKYPAVTLSTDLVQIVAKAFGEFVRKTKLSIWACSILGEHVHMVIERFRYSIEQVTNLLKGAAQTFLINCGLHPLIEYRTKRGRIPSMWADKRWKVYLDSEEAIEAAIRYVIQNPIREGWPAQVWPFVQPFGGIETGACMTYE